METSLEDAELERRVAERTADLEASNAATEQALRESEARFRALIENSFDITAITDGDGLIRYVSPSVERILGYQPHELEGSTFSEFVHPGDVFDLGRALRAQSRGRARCSCASHGRDTRTGPGG